jgi:DNA-binding transcriptional LysR family regulator
VTARLTALRRGELDLALARGVLSGRGLRVLPAWSEPLHAVVSRHHPAAARETVGIDELEDDVLRVPSRRQDPPLHDAIVAAVRAAGVHPKLGRPTGTTQDTVVEVGSDPRSWALLSADQLAEVDSRRVRAVPLDSPITVTGNVVTVDNHPTNAANCAALAFRDGM